MLKYIYSHTGFPYVLLAGALVSFLDPDPDGDGRVPLPFFGRTVPLFTVGRNGRVAIIGLAGREDDMTRSERTSIRVSTCSVFKITLYVLPPRLFVYTFIEFGVNKQLNSEFLI